jgi:PPM family protein phosphatase
MNCPKCQVVILPSDRFCEECGTSLIEADFPPVEATQTPGCSKCGALPIAIDAEGYCSSCGFRNQFGDRDRFEVLLSEDLAGVCDRGLRHSKNEDYLALQRVEQPQAQVLVVCDGVSSSQYPELASQAAATTTCDLLSTSLMQGKNANESMQAAIAAALKAVAAIPYELAVDDDPPSTTLVAAIVQDRLATIGWLGDSRAYWIATNSPDDEAINSQQLTVDDSWLNDVVSSGRMSEAAALRSPQAHAITGWLGADVRDSAQPSIIEFPIAETGYLLLCSDGLWNYAPQAAQILALVQQVPLSEPNVPGGNATAVSRHLVDFARSQGGYDNITVAILYLSRE